MISALSALPALQRRRARSVGGLLGLGLLLLASARAAPVPITVLGLMAAGDAPQHAAMQELVDLFNQDHPEITASLAIETYDTVKPRFLEMLSNHEFDVGYWYAAQPLRRLVDAGVVEPLDDLRPQMADLLPTAVSAATIEGHLYAVPVAFYQWGIYYNRRILEAHRIAPPTDWAGFLAACHRLQAAGITPIAVGTRFPWPLGGWFDYINMRLHGPDFHIDLLAGKHSFKSPEVAETLAALALLLPLMNPDRDEMELRDALVQLRRDLAGFILSGNFIATQMKESDRALIGFMPFPVMRAGLPDGEDAPTDVFLVARSSPHREAAKAFAAFMASGPAQEILDHANGLIPVNRRAAPPTGLFVAEGITLLNHADRLAQFFDRDIIPPLLAPALAALADFAAGRISPQETADRLEAARVASGH